MGFGTFIKVEAHKKVQNIASGLSIKFNSTLPSQDIH